MLAVISKENITKDEANIVNQLFRNGLSCFHLRKKTTKEQYYRNYIEAIEPHFRDKIMLHNFHDLAIEYNLKGVHWKEANRQVDNLEKEVNKFKEKGFCCSTSYHQKEELEQTAALFNYVFLSPVFSSISKTEYAGKNLDVTNLNRNNIFALGGVKVSNINDSKKLGYNGVATLGSVWLDKNPLSAFLSLKEEYQKVFK